MADDIVTRLLDVVCWCNEFDGVCDACQAADEIERLRRWKAEATAVLNRWDSLCGRTLEVVRIGDRKSDAMATYVESQKAEIERLRAEIERKADYAERMDALAEERLIEANRLRAAGDALADSVETALTGYSLDIYQTLPAWRKARHG